MLDITKSLKFFSCTFSQDVNFFVLWNSSFRHLLSVDHSVGLASRGSFHQINRFIAPHWYLTNPENIISRIDRNPRSRTFSQNRKVLSIKYSLLSDIYTEKLWFFVFFRRKSGSLRPKTHILRSWRAPDTLPPLMTRCQIWCTIELHRDLILKVLLEW